MFDNYKVVDLVEYYNYDVDFVSIRHCQPFHICTYTPFQFKKLSTTKLKRSMDPSSTFTDPACHTDQENAASGSTKMNI